MVPRSWRCHFAAARRRERSDRRRRRSATQPVLACTAGAVLRRQPPSFVGRLRSERTEHMVPRPWRCRVAATRRRERSDRRRRRTPISGKTVKEVEELMSGHRPATSPSRPGPRGAADHPWSVPDAGVHTRRRPTVWPAVVPRGERERGPAPHGGGGVSTEAARVRCGRPPPPRAVPQRPRGGTGGGSAPPLVMAPVSVVSSREDCLSTEEGASRAEPDAAGRVVSTNPAAR